MSRVGRLSSRGRTHLKSWLSTCSWKLSLSAPFPAPFPSAPFSTSLVGSGSATALRSKEDPRPPLPSAAALLARAARARERKHPLLAECPALAARLTFARRPPRLRLAFMFSSQRRSTCAQVRSGLCAPLSVCALASPSLTTRTSPYLVLVRIFLSAPLFLMSAAPVVIARTFLASHFVSG